MALIKPYPKELEGLLLNYGGQVSFDDVIRTAPPDTVLARRLGEANLCVVVGGHIMRHTKEGQLIRHVKWWEIMAVNLESASDKGPGVIHRQTALKSPAQPLNSHRTLNTPLRVLGKYRLICPRDPKLLLIYRRQFPRWAPIR